MSFMKKIFNKKNSGLIISVSLFILILVLDIVSKRLVNRYIGLNGGFNVIPHLFNFVHVHNTGGAFGVGSDNGIIRVIFIIIPVLALIGLVFALIKFGRKSKVLAISLGLMAAGALGNLIDRVILGYVDDFIQFAFWDSFAIFNVADIGVTFGVVLFAIYIIFIYKEPEKHKKIENEEKDT